MPGSGRRGGTLSWPVYQVHQPSGNYKSKCALIVSYQPANNTLRIWNDLTSDTASTVKVSVPTYSDSNIFYIRLLSSHTH